MKLKAFVHRVTGKTTHRVGTLIDGMPVAHEKMSDAAWVVIEERDGSCTLIRYSRAGEFAGDTWHPTFEEAKRQARFEYDIQDSDWFLED